MDLHLATTDLQPTESAGRKFTWSRRKPEETVLWQLVNRRPPAVRRKLVEAADGEEPPRFLDWAVKALSACGRRSEGFSRLFCPACKWDPLVARSSKRV